MEKGFLISVEGIDGSGKTLFAKNLYKELINKKQDVVLTYETGDTQLGKKIRTILHEDKECICDLSEYLLIAADRAQHFEQVIIPALEAKKIIISDRMADSSLAYQGYGRNLDLNLIKIVNSWAMHNIEPDLIFFIEIDIQTALERISKRNEKLTSFEKEKKIFWEKVATGYNKIFENRKNVIKLDGKKTPEEILKVALDKLSYRLI